MVVFLSGKKLNLAAVLCITMESLIELSPYILKIGGCVIRMAGLSIQSWLMVRLGSCMISAGYAAACALIARCADKYGSCLCASPAAGAVLILAPLLHVGPAAALYAGGVPGVLIAGWLLAAGASLACGIIARVSRSGQWYVAGARLAAFSLVAAIPAIMYGDFAA